MTNCKNAKTAKAAKMAENANDAKTCKNANLALIASHGEPLALLALCCWAGVFLSMGAQPHHEKSFVALNEGKALVTKMNFVLYQMGSELPCLFMRSSTLIHQ